MGCEQAAAACGSFVCGRDDGAKWDSGPDKVCKALLVCMDRETYPLFAAHCVKNQACDKEVAIGEAIWSVKTRQDARKWREGSCSMLEDRTLWPKALVIKGQLDGGLLTAILNTERNDKKGRNRVGWTQKGS